MSVHKLREAIFERIWPEIFSAHECLGLYASIARYSDELNESNSNHLFGFVQRQALSGLVLSVCKLFENSKHYENFSIPTGLRHFREDITNISAQNRNLVLFETFIRKNVDPSFSVENSEDIDRIPNLVHKYFDESCPRSPARCPNRLNGFFEAVKVLRDKRVAHDEDCDLTGSATADMVGVVELLCFAKTFVNVVGYGFLGFSLDSEAHRDEFSPERSRTVQQMRKLVELHRRSVPNTTGNMGL